MLYRDIFNLEAGWRNFNRRSFSSPEIIEFAEDNRTIILPDHSVESACAINFQNKNFIFYNPHKPESEIILAIGHELGHFGLGHVKPGAGPIHANYFDCSKNERDAGIIGFLFWLSTSVLKRMEAEGRLDLEQVLKPASIKRSSKTAMPGFTGNIVIARFARTGSSWKSRRGTTR